MSLSENNNRFCDSHVALSKGEDSSQVAAQLQGGESPDERALSSEVRQMADAPETSDGSEMPMADAPEKSDMPEGSRLERPEMWYVLRVTYQREMVCKEKLEVMGVKCFLPVIKQRRQGRGGRFVWVVLPAIHNFLFVHTTLSVINTIKTEHLPYLRYIMQGGKDSARHPMVVPDKQMNDFIAVAGSSDEHVAYLNPDELHLTVGDKVRVIGGPLIGVEGYFVRIQNKRDRHVVVRIPGIVAVATSVPAVLVEKVIEK